MKISKARSARWRRAFTLVELLIVMIIIGILAGMMMVSSGAATDNARAARIINDIRAMKAAAVLYHAEYGAWPIWIHMGAGSYRNAGSGDKSILPSHYFDTSAAGDDYWIGVMYDRTTGACYSNAYVAGLDRGVREKLEAKAKETGLYGSESGPQSIALDDLEFYTADKNGIISIISK